MSHRCRHQGRRHWGGFTLLEVLVVFALLGMALLVVGPALKRGFGSPAQELGRELLVNLRKARTEAVLERRSVALWIDLDERRFFVEGGGGGKLPETLQVDAAVAASESGRQRAGVRFYPDGSSSGGSIELRHDNERVVVDIDWLTGRVSLRDDAA